MKITQRGVEALMDMEGISLASYYDVADLETIGVGHLLTKAERESGVIVINDEFISYRNGGLTREQVGHLLQQDLRSTENTVNKLVTVPLTDNQFDALVCFCFNVGNTAFKASTLLKRLNAGQYDAVPGQMRQWVYITKGGRKVVSNGLKIRREKEVSLWKDGAR
jgi:lysozyme